MMILCILVIFCVSCKDEGLDSPVVKTSWVTYKVAIICPLTENKKEAESLKNTAQWFTDNFYQAQAQDSVGVKLEFEWHDEMTEDMNELGKELADREDILAIVGPFYSSNVNIIASYCASRRKPLIAPVASSEDLIRRYSCSSTGDIKKPFLWSLTETDISQSEAILGKVSSQGGKSISIISDDNIYGKTFYEWMPFQATELGLEVKDNVQFKDSTELSNLIQNTLHSGADYVVCAVNSPSEAVQIMKARVKMGDNAPRLLFSDGALGDEILEAGSVVEGAEGVAMYADPTTGFQISYETKFGETPKANIAQFYDALMLTGLAANYLIVTGTSDLNNAIVDMTENGQAMVFNAWNEVGMQLYLYLVKNSHLLLKLRGASGNIKFDSEAFTSVLSSTYVHWMVYQGKIITLDFTTSTGSNRVAANLASWNWQAKEMQTIADENADVQYGEIENQVAVLICGSKEWANYRHQADVLNMYQLLKKNGYDDDHIILALANDIANNKRNKHPGVIRTSTDGDNLYQNVNIDYCTDTLSALDISNILLGNQSSHLPVVLHTNKNTNIFFYWSGHGDEKDFRWLSSTNAFTNNLMKNTVDELYSGGKFRKMLMCVEPCFSGSVVDVVQGVPGVLAISSANEKESSFADNYSNELGVWMCDRFSSNLVSSIRQNPEITYRDLYTYLVKHTLGSHVRIYNASLFDNLYRSNPREFFVKEQK